MCVSKTKIFFYFFILILAPIVFLGQAQAKTNWDRSLTIKITNIKSEKGDLKISLQSDPKLFGTTEGIKNGNNRILKVSVPTSQFVYSKVKKGRYAVMVFQDLNGNDKLDLDLFDKPLEPYGFSNNPKVSERAPTFNESAFDLKGDMVITVKL